MASSSAGNPSVSGSAELKRSLLAGPELASLWDAGVWWLAACCCVGMALPAVRTEAGAGATADPRVVGKRRTEVEGDRGPDVC